MAKVFPDFEVINTIKQKITEGELFLLKYLADKFDDTVEVYFEPFFNGERPDIVIVHKDRGIIIIEVKDWNLSSYYLDEDNKWHVKKNDVVIKSPFAQVFSYKKNMFDIHVNGLLEKSLKNKNFYNVISCYVYFHNASKSSLNIFFNPIIKSYQEKIKNLNDDYKKSLLDHMRYEKKRDFLISKLKRTERDLYKHSINNENLNKIKFPLENKSDIYPESVYNEFLRYLQPPFHYRNELKPIEYTKLQERLCLSEQGKREKIKGAAGSGKTTVLAKRAVNAHKRHQDTVLILTFNLTLRMYIKDKINEVRDEFSWGAFGIINYHRFINSAMNNCGIEIYIPKDVGEASVGLYLEENYYSNEKLFDDHDIKEKFETILIDEVQDYKPEWIKIIRKYFLEHDGEMVLFGDEKQNIYDREVDDEKVTTTVQGFGRWEKLSKSFRFKEDSHILNLAIEFQAKYFSNRYDVDFSDTVNPSLAGLEINQCVVFEKDKLPSIVSYIYKLAKQEKTHPNDMVILSSNISQMRKVDHIIRTNESFNEKTLTTFESEEAYESPKRNKKDIEKIRNNKKYGFNLNSGVIKISTIHSFKGYESPTVFLIINEGDNEELIYVGITRAKYNLVVFIESNSKYFAFFKSRLELVIL